MVDEFADLMMTAGKKVEELIARLAQKPEQQVFTLFLQRNVRLSTLSLG